jgi:hypothetical protein
MLRTLKKDRLIAVRLPKADDAMIRQIAIREEMKASEVYRRAIGEFLAEDKVAQQYVEMLREMERGCV